MIYNDTNKLNMTKYIYNIYVYSMLQLIL